MARGRFRQKPFVVPGDITNKANTLARPIAEFLEMTVGKIGEGNLTGLITQYQSPRKNRQKRQR
jgi:hypothetical protein